MFKNFLDQKGCLSACHCIFEYFHCIAICSGSS